MLMVEIVLTTYKVLCSSPCNAEGQRKGRGEGEAGVMAQQALHVT